MNIYKPLVVQFEESQQLYTQAENFFVDKVLETIADNGTFRVALSGGKTPMPLYSRLGKNPIIPWESVEIFQTDERYTGKNDPNSNQLQLTLSFTGQVLEECKEVNFFDTRFPIEQAAKNYQDKIIALEEPFFDFTILGIGPDGHIASLFPYGNYLKHLEELVIPTTAPMEFAETQRLSMSIETLLNSKEILVLLTGDEKRDILPKMLESNLKASEFPAKFLLSHPNVYIYQCFDNNQ